MSVRVRFEAESSLGRRQRNALRELRKDRLSMDSIAGRYAASPQSRWREEGAAGSKAGRSSAWRGLGATACRHGAATLLAATYS
jgi:hypothetical protein